MKRFLYLIIAVSCNAFGTALMNQTALGLSAWGSSARNMANYFELTLGSSFIIISIFFYSISLIITKSFDIRKTIYSTIFLVSFGLITDLFIMIVPVMDTWHIGYRLFYNTAGLCILMFGITLHLRLDIAVHPMDVFMKSLQVGFKNIAIGTYATYGIAFGVAIIFGYLHGSIEGIHIGTVNTILLGGLLISVYDRYIVLPYMIPLKNKSATKVD